MDQGRIQVDASDGQLHPDSCRALFAGVLVSAISDCLSCGRADGADKGLLQRKAHSWINSLSTRPCSFVWYCGWLDIDPDLVRTIVNAPLSKKYKRMVAQLITKQGVYERTVRVRAQK